MNKERIQQEIRELREQRRRIENVINALEALDSESLSAGFSLRKEKR